MQVREALQDPVEDQRGERLGRWDGDAHVVHRAEVLFPAVEVGRHRLAVDEVVGVDQGSRPPDVEDDGDPRLLGLGPDPEEVGVARREPRRAARRDQECRRTLFQRVAGGADGALRVHQGDVEGRQQARVDRAELEHPPVVGPGGGVGQFRVAGVLQVVEAAVVERVEDELAGEPEQVEGAGPVRRR